MTYSFDYLVESFENAGFSLDHQMQERFIEYYKLLLIWNEKFNLTAITEFEDVVLKHFIDSAMLIRHFDIAKGHSLIDVGSGAGFPGIPLKILRPDFKVCLLDSLNKRVGFLNEVIADTGLEDIIAIHGRAEDLGRDEQFRERFDICVSRAVADLSVLSEYALPFVCPGGYFISYKSGSIDEELSGSVNAFSLLSGSFERTERFVLPGSDIERSLVFIKKESIMNSRFPRKASQIKKKPLLS